MLLLCILEAQWGYRTIKKLVLADTLFEILEECRTFKYFVLELKNAESRN